MAKCATFSGSKPIIARYKNGIKFELGRCGSISKQRGDIGEATYQNRGFLSGGGNQRSDRRGAKHPNSVLLSVSKRSKGGENRIGPAILA